MTSITYLTFINFGEAILSNESGLLDHSVLLKFRQLLLLLDDSRTKSSHVFSENVSIINAFMHILGYV
jgi:hypothetical protein